MLPARDGLSLIGELRRGEQDARSDPDARGVRWPDRAKGLETKREVKLHGPHRRVRRHQAARTPRARPTFVNAATARSMCSGRCAAESWTRIRERPFGTTGKKKPFT